MTEFAVETRAIIIDHGQIVTWVKATREVVPDVPALITDQPGDGGGSIVYGVVDVQVTIPSGGTELTPRCSMIGFPRGVGRAFQGSTLAATPSILRPAFVLGAFVNTAVVPPDPALDEVKGAIIVPPGTALCLQGIAAAGASPLVLLSLIYEEVPI